MKEARQVRAVTRQLENFHYYVFDKLAGSERLILNSIIDQLKTTANGLEDQSFIDPVCPSYDR